MIDLHCHLLPGIDDGPRDLDAAVELARAAAADGIATTAATPHCREDHPDVRPADLQAARAAVQTRLAAEGIDLELVQGGELGISWAREASDEDLARVSLGPGGRYLLVETPYSALTSTFEGMLFDLTLRGFDVLLAHPENNRSFHDEPKRLAELVRRGVLLQVTARALVPGDRRSRQRTRFARELVQEELVHVIATDAHSGRRFRPPVLAAGRDAARELVGAQADWMVEDVPAAILAGERLPARPASRRPGGPLRRLFSSK